MKCTTVVDCPEATVCDSHNFQLSPPTTMKITFNKEQATLNEPIDVKIHFCNPNQFAMTGVEMWFECSGIQDGYQYFETIEAGASVDFSTTCYPKRSGTKMFMVGVASNEASEYFAEEELYVPYGF